MAGKLEKEIESKFDVPWETKEAELMLDVAGILARAGWNLVTTNVEPALQFQYYDTPDLSVYQKGDTIRRVNGFPESSNPKATHRYDFKVGPIDERYEVKNWADDILTEEQISKVIRPHCDYNKIMPSALANTRHLKLFFEKAETYVEVTHDIFSVVRGSRFKELEIELEEGDLNNLKEATELVRTETGLLLINKQKYDRVIEGISDYAEILRGLLK